MNVEWKNNNIDFYVLKLVDITAIISYLSFRDSETAQFM